MDSWPAMTDIDLSRFKLWTVEELEAAFPLLTTPLCRQGRTATGTQGASAGADDIDESALPDDLMELDPYGVPARATGRECSWASWRG